MYIIVYRKGFITANNEFEPLDKIYKKFQSKSFKNVPSAVLYLLEIGAILSPLKYQLAVVEENNFNTYCHSISSILSICSDFYYLDILPNTIWNSL